MDTPPDAAPTAATPRAEPSFRHVERLRVRWAEVDAQRIVFNGHYLMYADTAVAGYWRSLAVPYEQTLAELGGDLFVRHASVDYAASARYDEPIEVGVRCAAIGRSSMRFEVRITGEAGRLVDVTLAYVWADPARSGSQPVPDRLRDLLGDFEDGQPMLQLTIGPRAGDPGGAVGAAGPAAAPVGGIEAVARNRLGQEVGRAWMQPADPAGAGPVLRDVQTHPALRRCGIGRQLVRALAAQARAQGAARWQAAGPAAENPARLTGIERWLQSLGFEPVDGAAGRSADAAERRFEAPLDPS